MGNAAPEEKPVLYWDGGCAFCRRWAGRWEKAAKGRVEYKTIQDAPPHIIKAAGGLPPQHLVLALPGGALRTGADAALTALATRGGLVRLLHGACRKIPGFRAASEFFYRRVARSRREARETAACRLPSGDKDRR